MEDPAPGAIVLPGHVAPLVGELADHPEQRFGALGEVPDLGRPVVHLGVDVGRVLGIPGRIHLVVPDALEVGRLGPRPGRGDEEIAAELEDETGQGRIVRPVKGLDALRGRKVRRRTGRQLDLDAPEEAPVLADVGFEERIEGLAGRGVEGRGDAGARVAGNVFIVTKFVAAAMRMVTASAPVTTSSSSSTAIVPPSATALSRASYRRHPVMPM